MSDCDCRRDDYLPTPPLMPPCEDIPLPPPRPLPPMHGCKPCPPKPGCGNMTPNYGLPLWKASDVTSWLMQMNGAMMRIDTIMHDLALRTGINGLPDDLVSSVSKVIQDVDVLKATVCELSNKNANIELLMQNMNTSFSAMKTDLASMQLSLTNFDTRLMTVDSANQANKNDITLIKTDLNMLSSTTKNLQSNLSQYQMATNQTLTELQSAASELTNSMDEVKPTVEKWLTNEIGREYLFTGSIDNGKLNPSGIEAGSNGNAELVEGANYSGMSLTQRAITAQTSVLYFRTPNTTVIKAKANVKEFGFIYRLPEDIEITFNRWNDSIVRVTAVAKKPDGTMITIPVMLRVYLKEDASHIDYISIVFGANFGTAWFTEDTELAISQVSGTWIGKYISYEEG